MSIRQLPKIAVAIVAAGRGERAGQSHEGPKQYREIGGQAVLARTVAAFASDETIGPIAIAIHRDDREIFERALGSLSEQVIAVEGSSSRQASVYCALEALRSHEPDFVLIHDGVRPFVDQTAIARLVEAMDGTVGALPAMAVSDTLKRADDTGLVIGTEPREGLYGAQTPQAFPYRTILDAHAKAADADPHGFTDDAALAEWAGIPVRIVEGSPENVKLTWARDIDMANRNLGGFSGIPDVRTGTGYDVHSFGPGDHVTLCGVAIPFERSLTGHSDADVGLHALTDALLATCSAGDIGTHFPPSDPQWKGANSDIFLSHAAQTVVDKGGRISNVDITIIAEAPKIGPHRTAMIEAIEKIIDIGPERISVKATTNERLGFVGRKEGIAAIATATVFYGMVK
ncbi:MAG: bifunctional 2-C-methyl-D-erythritol 4-phosphate cytidylyltransferase/2-C-methyl-D-erythritol 2,4-cyclodiphosphate synthase [Rhizobiaceae bacterium]